MKNPVSKRVKIVAVDLFCGVGGLTHGLRKSGVNVIAGYDIDSECAWPYEKNNGRAKFYKKDVTAISGEQIKKHFERQSGVSLLAGCAPCQPFSTYSLNKTDSADQRWLMLEQFSRLIDEAAPTLVTMENVSQVSKHAVFKKFIGNLNEKGYWTDIRIVKCDDYGIPQTRTRLVLLASLLGPIKLRSPEKRRDKKLTVRAVIGGLEAISAGESSISDPTHRASSLSDLNYQRIIAAAPGGSWRDWDNSLIAACHQEESGQTFAGVYGRMEWDKPSPTITTQFFGFGNGRFGHPVQNRALSLREGALLQTFPRTYEFAQDVSRIRMKTVGRLIGNAVPVRLGQIIGESLVSHVQSNR